MSDLGDAPTLLLSSPSLAIEAKVFLPSGERGKSKIYGDYTAPYTASADAVTTVYRQHCCGSGVYKGLLLLLTYNMLTAHDSRLLMP